MRKKPDYLEIGPTGATKRVSGLIGFLLFYLAISAALAGLLYYFTHNLVLAILLVGFMVIYTSVMGWLTMRKADDKDI